MLSSLSGQADRPDPAAPASAAGPAGRLVRLWTAHATVLGADLAAARLVSLGEGAEDAGHPPVAAYLPDAQPTMCLLLLADGSPLHLHPGLAGHGILPLGFVQMGPDSCALYHPDTGRWLCAGPPPAPPRPPVAPLIADRQVIAGFERLRMEPLSAADLDPATRARLLRLDQLLARPFDLDLLRAATPADAPLLEAIGRLLPESTLAALGEALAAAPARAALLAEIFPRDVFATLSLPKLAAWQSGGRQPDALAGPGIGPDLDGLDQALGGSGFVSLPQALSALARRATVPGQSLCIVASARNEGPFLLDWIAYHRAIGVERIFLYTNDDDDGSDALLEILARAGAVRWIQNRTGGGIGPQQKAFCHSLAVSPEALDYRWMLMMDLDEFLMVDPAFFASVHEFLRWHEACGSEAVALNWVNCGPAAQARWQEGFVGRRFPSSSGYPDRHIKTLFRPRLFNRASVHHPTAWRGRRVVFNRASGEPHRAWSGSGLLAHSEEPTDRFAWLNHYYYRSAEEFVMKFARSVGSRAVKRAPQLDRLKADRVEMFMTHFAQTRPARLQPEACAPGFDAERSALLALPGAAAAVEAINRTFAERIAAVVPLFREAPGVAEAGEHGLAFLRVLGLAA